MNKEGMDLLFNRLFAEAVKEGVNGCELPSDDVMEASWTSFCLKLKQQRLDEEKGVEFF